MVAQRVANVNTARCVQCNRWTQKRSLTGVLCDGLALPSIGIAIAIGEVVVIAKIGVAIFPGVDHVGLPGIVEDQ